MFEFESMHTPYPVPESDSRCKSSDIMRLIARRCVSIPSSFSYIHNSTLQIQQTPPPPRSSPPSALSSDMAADHPLRRWKPFLAAFGAIDAAIEAAAPGVSRDQFRRVRCDIVERLCDTSEKKESDELCQHLDRVMVESLLTLKMVPVTPAMLAKSDLVLGVRALKKHESPRVRSLARDIVSAWRASVVDGIVKATAATEKLSKMEPHNDDEKPTPSTGKAPGPCDHLHAEEPAKIPSQPTFTKVTSRRTDLVTAVLSSKATEPAMSKKTAALVAATGAGVDHGRFSITEDKIEASRRRLRESYQEAENAKRQRKIQVIKAPAEMVKQRERKQYPIMRERSRTRYAGSVTVRRSIIRAS
ncbi:hypothetical protein U9M48_017437 [Paspalum notatum var. saurae]|uniref:TFIIS N-terminal domain-containing protein n=1 Tax=Paspalum notatum var. saurae TaxID=547442 RepID=A0AAQ3WNV0_PASNO